jgi:hypothetical protein
MITRRQLIRKIVNACVDSAKTKEVKIQYTGVRAGGYYTVTRIDEKSILGVAKTMLADRSNFVIDSQDETERLGLLLLAMDDLLPQDHMLRSLNHFKYFLEKLEMEEIMEK